MDHDVVRALFSLIRDLSKIRRLDIGTYLAKVGALYDDTGYFPIVYPATVKEYPYPDAMANIIYDDSLPLEGQPNYSRVV